MTNSKNVSINNLKSTAILLIVLFHSDPFYGICDMNSFIDLNLATESFNSFILIFFRHLVRSGNYLFMVIISFFLLQSYKIKHNKVLKIILDSFSISIIICMIFLLYSVDITLKDLLNNILLNVLLLFVISIVVSVIISKLYNSIFSQFINLIISNVLNNNYLTKINNKLYIVIIRKGYVR